jgi:hypothetical protein
MQKPAVKPNPNTERSDGGDRGPDCSTKARAAVAGSVSCRTAQPQPHAIKSQRQQAPQWSVSQSSTPQTPQSIIPPTAQPFAQSESPEGAAPAHHPRSVRADGMQGREGATNTGIHRKTMLRSPAPAAPHIGRRQSSVVQLLLLRRRQQQQQQQQQQRSPQTQRPRGAAPRAPNHPSSRRQQRP